jgi:hypothetical protein
MNVLITNMQVRNAIIQNGFENIQRFNWDRCARLVAKVVVKF